MWLTNSIVSYQTQELDCFEDPSAEGIAEFQIDLYSSEMFAFSSLTIKCMHTD